MISTVPSIVSAAPAPSLRNRATRRRLGAALILLCAWPSLWPSLAGADSIAQRLVPCFSCHGDNGQSFNPDTPSLGAQPPPYVLIQLFMFREKLRRFEQMNEAVKGFSDDDLRTFADAIAKLPPPPPTGGPANPARIERGQVLVHQYRCNVCHNADLAGRDNVPRIAGQREDFLVKTMREYKANTRPGYDASMGDVLQPVSDADILDLAYFTARQP
jgi:cytochrome c553